MLIYPSKVTSFRQSSFNKLPILIDSLSTEINIVELYELVEKYFEETSEFIDAVSILYILDKIKYKYNKGTIYVKRNNM